MSTTVAAADPLGQPVAGTVSYQRLAAACAVLTGLLGFRYSVAFVVLRSDLLSDLFLPLTGVLSAVVLIEVYGGVRGTDASFAMLGLLFGVTAALGSAIHGGFDLANALHPPASSNVDLPSQIDPRGMLTFGLAGIAIGTVAWLIVRGRTLPVGLGYLGYLAAVLVMVVYLARLIILDPTSPAVLAPALLVGFIASPLWYVWLGLSLYRAPLTARAPDA